MKANRAALTEAVSALEVALATFARSPQTAKLLPTSLRLRLGVESLPRLIERIGLTGSVAVVLPFVVPEDHLPADVLAACRNAIVDRQTVVHQGQRDVDAVKLRAHLRGLRRLCEVLLQLAGQAI
jgi:hypothetical protein